MPTLMAAIVMVIKSSGIEKSPITPNTTPAEKMFGMMVMSANLKLANNTTNMMSITKKTVPSVMICELNNEFNMLL